jgi:hypothetical protein
MSKDPTNKTADQTAPHLSPTIALRLRALDKLLRELGYAAEDGPTLEKLTPVIALLVSARAEDYSAGREGRTLSTTSFPAVKPR